MKDYVPVVLTVDLLEYTEGPERAVMSVLTQTV